MREVRMCRCPPGNVLEEIIWRKKSRAINFARKIIEKLIALGEKGLYNFEECVLSGRFDKLENHIDNTVIIGDDGGLYCLLNSLTKSIRIFIK